MSFLRCAAFLALSAAVVATAQSSGGDSRPGDAPRGGDVRPPDSRPESAPAGTDFAEEYWALVAEYDKAIDDYMKPVIFAKEGPAAGDVLKLENHPLPVFRPRFIALYERARGTSAGLNAAWWLIHRSPSLAAYPVEAQLKEYSRLLDSAVEAYGGTADGLKLAEALLQAHIGRSLGETETIRKLLAKAPAETRPDTAYVLVRALTRNPSRASDVERAEALVILKELAAEKGLRKSLASAVADDLFRLERLCVGAVAPDFTATDLDGVAFKLSDYRGKVVVLDFWGLSYFEHPETLPHKKAMVHRLSNEPFALIGVNSDGKPAEVKPLFEKEGITWRNAIDETTSGKLATAWRVRGWPTIYVIDHLGVIRAVDLWNEELEAKVVELIKAAKAAASK